MGKGRTSGMKKRGALRRGQQGGSDLGGEPGHSRATGREAGRRPPGDKGTPHPHVETLLVTNNSEGLRRKGQEWRKRARSLKVSKDSGATLNLGVKGMLTGGSSEHLPAPGPEPHPQPSSEPGQPADRPPPRASTSPWAST